jgi:hypothetical protein
MTQMALCKRSVHSGSKAISLRKIGNFTTNVEPALLMLVDLSREP